MDPFQVNTKTLAIRNALLDLAEKNGWKINHARSYWTDDLLWLVVRAGEQSVGGNTKASIYNHPVQSIEHAIDVLSQPQPQPICKIGEYEVWSRADGVIVGCTTVPSDKIKLIYEAVFGKQEAGLNLTGEEAALLNAILARVWHDNSTPLGPVFTSLRGKIGAMYCPCTNLGDAVDGRVSIDKIMPF